MAPGPGDARRSERPLRTDRHPAPGVELPAAEQEQLDALQRRVGVHFRRQDLLRQAMTHASWNNERGHLSSPGDDNERLEYLGDAVLELVAGEYLYRRFPGYDEGQLTQLRAALVNTASLARLAERLQLGEALLLGKGAAKTGAGRLPSLLANAFEALIGALFLDQGYRVAARVFLQNIGDLGDWSDENFKGRLQELSQERRGVTPTYRVVAAGGPGHRREYVASVQVGDETVGEGRARTKQAAEQAAAREALGTLQKHTPTPVARAAGAARAAARSMETEPARVRRRVTEVAADTGSPRAAKQRSRGRAPDTEEEVEMPAAPAQGILGRLKAVADILVGKPRPEDGEESRPAEEPAPPSRSRSRRGRRGGRGRGGARASRRGTATSATTSRSERGTTPP